jgi:hypothetical protein
MVRGKQWWLMGAIALLGLVLGAAGGVLVTRATSHDTPAAAPSLSPAGVPVKLADCHEQQPPSGTLPVVGGTQPIVHPAMVCGQPFDEVVDLTLLGNWSGCHDAPEALDSQGRPCRYPLRPFNPQGQPDFRTPSYPASVWAPREGDRVHVQCQMLGNDIKSQGALSDKTGSLSKVWDKITDDRLPGGYGLINDKFLFDRGWRNVPCR